MSSTTEFAELHELVGGLRRCVTSLASKYGDSPATRRIVNDAERILNDVDRLVPAAVPGAPAVAEPATYLSWNGGFDL